MLVKVWRLCPQCKRLMRSKTVEICPRCAAHDHEDRKKELAK